MNIEAIRTFVTKNRKGLIAVAIVVGLCVVGAVVATAEQRCTDRGIAYFKEIGSWPTLSTGRDAETVAAERCARTTSAF